MKENPKLALIQYRLDLATEVLTDAQKLFQAQGSPRSIVNRSYYAMFYTALAVLTIHTVLGRSDLRTRITVLNQYT